MRVFIVTYLCSVVGVYSCAVDAEQCIRALKRTGGHCHSVNHRLRAAHARGPPPSVPLPSSFAKGNREGRRGVVSIHQYVQCDCIEYTMHSTYRMISRDCSAMTGSVDRFSLTNFRGNPPHRTVCGRGNTPKPPFLSRSIVVSMRIVVLSRS